MKTIQRAAGVACLAAMLAGCAGTSSGTSSPGQSPDTPGLQLYSLRGLGGAKGVPAALDQAKAFGFKTLEIGGSYNLKPSEVRSLLEERGLKAVSSHFPWDRWKNDPEGVAAEAKALG